MLTEEQKAKVRMHLGYPDVNREQYHSLEGAMQVLSAPAVAQVADLLAGLDQLWDQLKCSWGRQKIESAEGVKFAGPGEIRALRSEGRRLAQALADRFEVKLIRSVFQGGSGSGAMGRG